MSMKDRVFNLLLLLSVSAALVLSLSRGGSAGFAVPEISSPAAPVETLSPLSAYRARRAEERKTEAEALLSLSRDAGLEQESRDAAWQRLLSLQSFTETELRAEALLTGRGYGEALCIADEKNLLVVLGSSLDGEEAREILALLEEISAYPAQNIRITC